MSASRNGFQSVVNNQPAPATVGDWAGTNPRMSVNAPSGGFVADEDGVLVGRFAWGDYATGKASNVEDTGLVLGFVHREQQALITAYLGQDTLLIPEGQPVTLTSQGDVWAYINSAATVGQRVYADPATGAASISSGGGNIATPWYVASPVAADVTFTGVIDGALGVLTASAVTGLIQEGQYITGTDVPANTRIVSQLTGTAGGAGTYQTNQLHAVGSTAMTATAGKLAKISTWQGS